MVNHFHLFLTVSIITGYPQIRIIKPSQESNHPQPAPITEMLSSQVLKISIRNLSHLGLVHFRWFCSTPGLNDIACIVNATVK